MTHNQWLTIVGWMCELWPHSPIEPDTATAWWPFIAHLDDTDVRHAIAQLALEPGRRFPPGVGDIVDTATDDHDRDWHDAWTDVYHATAGLHGRIRYDGDDPKVADFLATLGEWREQVDEASPALRAQFRDHYRARHDRQRTAQRHTIATKVAHELAPVADRLSLPDGDHDG